MFPLSFPLHVLAKARPRQVVLDPFCGRGTTIVAGRINGLASYGIDANPVAAAIAEAKLAHCTPNSIVTACRRILAQPTHAEVPKGEFWRRAYHPATLLEIVKIRDALMNDCESSSRKALRAVMLGALHGPQRVQDDWHLSNQMPRTFATKPDYSTRFWKATRKKARAVDTLDVVRRRAFRHFASAKSKAVGKVILGDSRKLNLRPTMKNVDWVITSPPYYGMDTYVADQWLRNWFVGGPPHVEYTSPHQVNHGGVNTFAHDLAQVWMNVATVCRDGAHMFIRFGGINERPEEPREILLKSMEYASRVGWTFVRSTKAGEPHGGKRQANHFGQKMRGYRDERDYEFVLSSK